MDKNKDLVVHDQKILSAFFRGAAKKKTDRFLDSSLCIGGGECLKYDDQAKLQYWKVPNTSKEPISGAGFWRFDCGKKPMHISLEGVITSEDRSEDRSFFEAMPTPCLYEDFLPKLKNFCKKQL
ncbi:MAG: hypothetical protein KR126chlam5_01040 [Candidatus Anoxychlamydiales bacterium]|nr:hypothetical protein [Candidatus Anoxychlamydiales bacterium]